MTNGGCTLVFHWNQAICLDSWISSGSVYQQNNNLQCPSDLKLETDRKKRVEEPGIKLLSIAGRQAGRQAGYCSFLPEFYSSFPSFLSLSYR